MEKLLSKLIENYSREQYDFNPDKLTKDDIEDIKKISREKRYDYGNAPIGTNIFKFIRDTEKDIFFESDEFSTDFDAMICLPEKHKNLAFIILNRQKPLVNQIFAAAHEYYHYIKDIDDIRKEPLVCSLSDSKEKREQKASRFAAEFLLPEEALKNEINRLTNVFKCDILDSKDYVAVLCYLLSINYALPLKAAIYRLHEEKYLKDISKYIDDYEFLKKSLSEVNRRLQNKGQELMDTGNDYIEEIMYDYIPKAYEKGYISYDKLLGDIETLQLNIKNFGIEAPDISGAETNEPELDDKKLEALRKKLNLQGEVSVESGTNKPSKKRKNHS